MIFFILLLLLASSDAASLDVCIVGGGPAGLQLVRHLDALGIKSVVVWERDDKVGSFFTKYPVHRKLISINKAHLGKGVNPEFALRHDWNSLIPFSRLDAPGFNAEVMLNRSKLFTSWSSEFFPPADRIVEYLEDWARDLVETGKVRLNSKVERIARDNATGLFSVHVSTTTTTTSEVNECRFVVIATGVLKERSLEGLMAGWSLAESYGNLSRVAPETFKDQKVLIIGSGNSAHETSLALKDYAESVHIFSRKPIRLSFFTHYVGDVRALNVGTLDTYQLKSMDTINDGFNPLAFSLAKCQADENFHMGIVDFKKGADESKKNKICLVPAFPPNLDPQFFEHIPQVRSRYVFDRVISCIGFLFDDSIFDADVKPVMITDETTKRAYPFVPPPPSNGKTKPESLSFVQSGRFPAISGEYESMNIPGLFFAGTLAHSRDYRRTAGGFIHGFRYTTRALAKILDIRLKKMSNSIPKETCASSETCGDAKATPLEWPGARIIPFSNVTEEIFARMTTSSGLYQMFGELVDLVILHYPEVGKATYLEEFPRSMCLDAEPIDSLQKYNWAVSSLAPRMRENKTAGMSGSENIAAQEEEDKAWLVSFHESRKESISSICDTKFDRFMLTYRYGESFHGPKVIEMGRIGSVDPRFSEKSNFLHPIIEFTPNKEKPKENKVAMIHARQQHILEDILIRWEIEDQFRNPFREFFLLFEERLAKRDGHQFSPIEEQETHRHMFPRVQGSRVHQRPNATEIRVRVTKRYYPLVPGDRAIFLGETFPQSGVTTSPLRFGALRSERHQNETFTVPSSFFVPE